MTRQFQYLIAGFYFGVALTARPFDSTCFILILGSAALLAWPMFFPRPKY